MEDLNANNYKDIVVYEIIQNLLNINFGVFVRGIRMAFNE
jgi:hypothetical protein